jgi:Flp pilus assembly protein TadD
VLETAAVLSPDNVDVLMGYGAALQKTNDLKGALRQYQKAIELDPNMCLAYYRAAYVLVGLGRYGEAAATLEAMFTKDPPENLAAEARKFLAEIEARLPGRR